MHLGNGALTPECVVLSYGAAAAGLAAVSVATRGERTMWRSQLPLAAGLGGLVLALQAINLPILPGVSGHVVGGALLVWLLGPCWGAWTMTVVLAVQAIWLGDGGLLALGANVLNMALVPAGLFAAGRGLAGQSPPLVCAPVGPALLAGAAVPLAAVLICIETALFRTGSELAQFERFAALLLGLHVVIGVLEGLATAAIIAALGWWTRTETRPAWQPALVGLGACMLLVAATLLPVSSSLPDGYEAAAQQSGLGWLLEGPAR
jgi:cobalt/nickel transport system permease protein